MRRRMSKLGKCGKFTVLSCRIRLLDAQGGMAVCRISHRRVTYAENLGIRVGCLHLPTFQQQCNALWSNPNAMPDNLNQTDFSFLIVYLACLTTGLHLMDEYRLSTLGLTTTDQKTLAKSWWHDVAVTLLDALQWQGFHTIELLQSFL